MSVHVYVTVLLTNIISYWLNIYIHLKGCTPRLVHQSDDDEKPMAIANITDQVESFHEYGPRYGLHGIVHDNTFFALTYN